MHDCCLPASPTTSGGLDLPVDVGSKRNLASRERAMSGALLRLEA